MIGSIFMEESFGGLIRAGWTPEELSKKLRVTHETLPSLVTEAKYYMSEKYRQICDKVTSQKKVRILKIFNIQDEQQQTRPRGKRQDIGTIS